MSSPRGARATHSSTVGASIAGAEATITVTQVRSAIGVKPKTRGTLRALGLRGIGQTNVLPDRPEIRGMIHRVPHLVTVTTSTSTGDGS